MRISLPTKDYETTSDPPLLVLVSSKVVLEDKVCPATLVISKDTGKIIRVERSILCPTTFPPSAEYHDYAPLILMPGLVDTHVHLNEPGRTSTEGFFTGSQAAAAGGVTTIVDMPLNSIPATTTVAGLQTKIDAARGKCWVDVGFLGGIVPGNVKELKPLVKAGVRGFKSFLIDSGVAEFPMVQFDDIRDAMLELKDSPTMLMFHAEKIPKKQIPGFEPREPPWLYPNGDNGPLYVYDNFLASRPPIFEDEAIKMLIELSHFAPDLPLHIAHVSTAEALPILRQAQDANVNISAETCFHYLSLSAEEIPMRDTRFKSEPPIRGKANQDQLWDALRKLYQEDGQEQKHEPMGTMTKPKKDLRLGPITTVVSDHSPCSPEAKFLPSYIPPHSEPDGYHQDVIESQEGNFFTAWGGIASVGLGLQILWTDFHRRKMIRMDPYGNSDEGDSDVAIRQITEWVCRNTAELVGLGSQKGRLKVGCDGDVCVFDPNADWVVRDIDLLFRHKMSPYEGRQMRGRVKATWLRGIQIFQLGGHGRGFIGYGPEGRLLLEERRPEGRPPLEGRRPGGRQPSQERRPGGCLILEEERPGGRLPLEERPEGEQSQHIPEQWQLGRWLRSSLSAAYSSCVGNDDRDNEEEHRLLLPHKEK